MCVLRKKGLEFTYVTPQSHGGRGGGRHTGRFTARICVLNKGKIHKYQREITFKKLQACSI